MERILYLDHLPDDLKQIVLKKVPAGVTLKFWSSLSDQQKDRELRQAVYFILTAYKVDDNILRIAENLKLIQKVGIGTDNINLAAAARMEVPVSNTPGGNSISVSEATILFILALYRRLVEINPLTKQGNWYSWNFRSSSYEMYGKAHGLIGMGNIGYETAKRSAAFGTNIVYCDKRRLSGKKEKEINAQFVSLDKLLQVSDIISIHVPLLPETEGLIGATEFKQMKNNAILINVARGGVVNERDLYEALIEGRISGAAIDAWESEPVRADHPLLALDNVLATPHIGGGTLDSFNRTLDMAFENLNRVRRGEEPKFIVNGQ